MTHPRRFIALFSWVALFAAALCLATRPDGYAADKSNPQKAESGPLDFVPADTFAVVTVRVSDLWKHPAGKAVWAKLTEGLPDAAKAVRAAVGVGPDEIDRVTMLVPTPKQGAGGPGPVEPLIAVTTLKPYDQKAVLAAAAPDAKEKKVKDRSFYLNLHGSSFVFVDDHTFVVSQPDQLEALLEETGGKAPTTLAPVLKQADKHLIAAGVDMAALVRANPPPADLPPDIRPFKPLLKAQLITLTVDLDDKLRAAAQATFATEADAKDGTAAVDDALNLTRAGLLQMSKELNRFEDAPYLTALLKVVQAALREAKAEQKGTAVEVEAAIKIDPEATAAAAAEAVTKIQTAAQRIGISNDLKQLALASIIYADSHDGKMLPAAVVDKNGKPLLSWRVLVLPYIEQDDLYKQFHLDEPWDGEHNKKLIEKMPPTFAPPNSEAFKKHETFFQAFVGAGSVFDGNELRYPASITDGTSQTIMFAEAATSVPWTKPEDIPFDKGKLAPKLGGLTKNGFMVAFCDGSVRLLSRSISEETLRALVTRDAGDIPGADLDK